MPTATATESGAPKAKPAPTKSAPKKPAEPTKKPAEPTKKPAEPAKKAAAEPAKKAPADAGKQAGNKAPKGAGTEKKAVVAANDKKAPPARKEATAEEEVVAPPVYVPKLPVSLPVLNTLEAASCAKVLGNLLNVSPSLGFALANLRPFKSTQHLLDQLSNTLETLPLSCESAPAPSMNHEAS